ncbi:MAG: hypothetical protein AAF909_12350 [Pseudomonadota bacterium]
MSIQIMVSGRFTQPTSTLFRDGTNPKPSALTFTHAEASIPKPQRERSAPAERRRLDKAAQVLREMHAEAELATFLVSKLPKRKQALALARAYRSLAERWYVDGVAGLPEGFVEVIRAQGLDRTPPRVRPSVRADQELLDLYPDELRDFTHLRGKKLL